MFVEGSAEQLCSVVPDAAKKTETAPSVDHGDQPGSIVFDLVEPTVTSRPLLGRADDLQANAIGKRRLERVRRKSNGAHEWPLDRRRSKNLQAGYRSRSFARRIRRRNSARNENDLPECHPAASSPAMVGWESPSTNAIVWRAELAISSSSLSTSGSTGAALMGAQQPRRWVISVLNHCAR
jgi:hypothetical protein